MAGIKIKRGDCSVMMGNPHGEDGRLRMLVQDFCDL